MSLNILIPALFIYPLVYLLPLNPIRFRWGFRKGLAPMPEEVQEHAEAADRFALLTARLMLLVVVVLLMRISRISAHDLGLSGDNWKFPLAIGVALSLVPVGLNAILLPIASTKSAQSNLESRGPAATWFGLIALGSLSTELWRAFCILALLRTGLGAWLALAVVTIFYAAIWLQTGTASALGSASYGGMAGALFLYTGSTLAPLVMGLIAGAAHFHRVRYTLRPIENRRIQDRSSRYSTSLFHDGLSLFRTEDPNGKKSTQK